MNNINKYSLFISCFIMFGLQSINSQGNFDELRHQGENIQEDYYDDMNKWNMCRTDQFTCTNGDCIDLNLVCDNVPDCHDSSDESKCLGMRPNRRSHGETCDKFNRCSTRDWLRCVNGTCLCTKTEEMAYDKKRNECVSKVGERCKFPLGEFDDVPNRYDSIGCVENSICSKDGACLCKINYYESIEGGCEPVKGFKEPCFNSAECDGYNLDLYCDRQEGESEGECTCNHTVAIWSVEKGQCVGLAEEPCILSTCTDNSFCEEENQICTCNDGFYISEWKTCGKVKGNFEECRESYECNEKKYLSCIDEQCQCSLNETIWDSHVYEQCVGLAGSVCVEGRCTANSNCEAPVGLGVCLCNNDSFETEFSTCLPKRGIGENCPDMDSACKEKDFLICLNDTCQCDPSIGTWEKGACVGLSKKPCLDQRCTSGAECVKGINDFGKRNSLSDLEICQCKSSFYHAMNGTCQPKKTFSSDCKTSQECLEDKFLECTNGKCECNPEFSVWGKTELKCVGLNGKRCLDNKCTINAQCYSRNFFNGINHICECKPGFVLSSNRTLCYPDFEKPCSEINPCDPEKFACVDGKCTCRDFYHQTYDKELRNCRSLLGGTCKSQANCPKGAACINKGGYNHCECIDGFIEVNNGQCRLSYGSVCSGNLQNSDNLFRCEKTTPLYCIEGICQCNDSSAVYDQKKRKCLGLAGARCSNDNTLVSGASCLENSECFQIHPKIPGRCHCSRGFQEHNRTCIPINSL